MGMAASQARFLGLTARKSNVEYQGQQVNQQRTALANESANLYNQMMKLDVPTPPATTDYYKTAYELEDSETALTVGNYTISSMTKAYDKDDPNLYKVTLGFQTKETHTQDFSYRLASSKNAKESNYTYYDAAGNKATTNKLTKYTFKLADDSISGGAENSYTLTMYGNPIIKEGETQEDWDKYGTNAYTGENGSMSVTAGVIYKVDPTKDLEGKDECCTDPNVQYYFYKINGNTYFLTQNELTQMMEGDTSTDVETKRVYSKTIDHTVDVDADIEKSSTGRYSSIQIKDKDDYPKNLKGQPFDLNVKQVFDQSGYDNAMNDYNFQKDIYEKAVSDINAKTEVIQKQDQNLELRLDQLDTEQNAIKTEMDAVTKVIDDNVEKTFKTFA